MYYVFMHVCVCVWSIRHLSYKLQRKDVDTFGRLKANVLHRM